MSKLPYTGDYFQRYVERGKFISRLRGDKKYFYRYWASYLRRNLPPMARVAEVGCGLGFFSRYLDNSFLYVGLDVSWDAIAWGKEQSQICSVINGEAEFLPFKDQRFEALVAFDMVEHLENPRLFFDEARRVLKPNGIMVFTTPNVHSFGVKRKSKMQYPTPSMLTDKTHVSLFASDRWIQMINEAGFSILRLGTDTLWDLPYFKLIPVIVQKAVLIPVNMLITVVFGFLPWKCGENLVLVCRR
jgi:SAM-dependent methyltransferase